VSYGIVAAHGGRIEVTNTSAAGTTFRVTLPSHRDEADQLPASGAEAAWEGSRVPVS
jgi:K+-sensing histidine kinase KdpD